MSGRNNHLNPFRIAQKQIQDCADILDLNQSTRQVLLHPMREFHVNFPVRMDDGTTRISKVSGSTTMTPGGLQKGAFASIRTKPSTRCGLWPHG